MDEINARFAAIIAFSDDAIVSKDLNGTITSWNPGAERLFGYSPEQAIGRSMSMLIPPERSDEEAAILARIARGELTDHFETVRLRKDGSRVDVSVTISPIRDGSGRIVGASKIARDITDRKLADAKVQAQVGRLNLLHQITRAIGERQDIESIFQVVIRTLEERLPLDFCCICLYDAADSCPVVSRVGAHSAELATALGMGENSRIKIDENGLSLCVSGRLVYEADLSRIDFPFARRLSEGALKSLVAAPLSVESSVFGALIAARAPAECFSSGECEFLRQLSEHVALAAHQVQLYGALQQAYDDLRQMQSAAMQQERLLAVGQMASGVAHDINNAISPVTLYTEALLATETGLSQRGRGYLEIIQRAIDDVARTVARMREFYRPREATAAFTPVDLNEIARQSASLTRARWNDMAQERGTVIAMHLDLAAGLPPVLAAESEIREALTNLIFNAVDAMPDGGSITLSTRVTPSADPQRRHEYVEIDVADTGLGMDEETRRRCLEPFFTTKGERGTGLGLAMVYGAIRRHQADIEIESTPGKGTRMRLRIAAAPSSAASPSQSGSVLPAPMRILIIDDDPLVLRSLRAVLEMDGHEITSADSGQGGIDAFHAAQARGEPFPVVITDLGMPYVDGRKVAAAIKLAAPSTVVLLLTGWGQRLVTDGEVPPHIDRVLSKPPKLRELREALNQTLTPDQLR